MFTILYHFSCKLRLSINAFDGYIIALWRSFHLFPKTVLLHSKLMICMIIGEFIGKPEKQERRQEERNGGRQGKKCVSQKINAGI